MKAPVCHLCNRSLSSVSSRTATAGDLVRFADYRPLPNGVAGHPHGLEWFCAEHLASAEAFSGKSIDEAMLELGRVFGQFPPSQPNSLAERAGMFRRLAHSLRKYFGSF
jgi:hypothetical protein